MLSLETGAVMGCLQHFSARIHTHQYCDVVGSGWVLVEKILLVIRDEGGVWEGKGWWHWYPLRSSVEVGITDRSIKSDICVVTTSAST